MPETNCRLLADMNFVRNAVTHLKSVYWYLKADVMSREQKLNKETKKIKKDTAKGLFASDN